MSDTTNAVDRTARPGTDDLDLTVPPAPDEPGTLETALRWEHRLRASTATQRTQMVFRMLRIAGGPYWLLGTKGTRPVQLAVGAAVRVPEAGLQQP